MINGNRTKSERGRAPRDLYLTPPELALEAMIRFFHDENLIIREPLYALDAGCGTGIWGDAAKWFAHYKNGVAHPPNIFGVDIEPNVDNSDNIYTMIYKGDFLDYKTQGFNLIFGNPPYSLAEEFIRHSFRLLEPKGYIYFLLRLSFLEGIARGKGLFQEFPIKKVHVCSRRPSFFSTKEEGHTTDTLAYAMFLWQKGYNGKTELDFLDWEYKK